MQKKHIKSLILVIMILSGSHSLIFGQKSSMDHQRLKRNINIMEGVLDKLLEKNATSCYINKNTKGTYLQGFGVVFHTNLSGQYYNPISKIWSEKWEKSLAKFTEERKKFEEEMKKFHEQQNKLQNEISKLKNEITKTTRKNIVKDIPFPSLKKDLTVSLDSLRKSNIEQQKKTVESLKGDILFFFQNYASSMDQLQPDERIVILINLKDWGLTDSENKFLTGWITKYDIDRYRRKQMNKSNFNQLVHFNLTNSESDIPTDIDIMGEILDRAINTSSYSGISFNTGAYLNGLGALFFMDIPGIYWSDQKNNDSFSYLIKKYIENTSTHDYEHTTEKDKEENQKTRQEHLERMKNDLFEILSSYGHTLRLKPEEWVVLNVNLEHRFFFWDNDQSHNSNLVLQARKKDLDDYNRGSLSLSELRSKSIIRTY